MFVPRFWSPSTAKNSLFAGITAPVASFGIGVVLKASNSGEAYNVEGAERNLLAEKLLDRKRFPAPDFKLDFLPARSFIAEIASLTPSTIPIITPIIPSTIPFITPAIPSKTLVIPFQARSQSPLNTHVKNCIIPLIASIIPFMISAIAPKAAKSAFTIPLIIGRITGRTF